MKQSAPCFRDKAKLPLVSAIFAIAAGLLPILNDLASARKPMLTGRNPYLVLDFVYLALLVAVGVLVLAAGKRNYRVTGVLVLGICAFHVYSLAQAISRLKADDVIAIVALVWGALYCVALVFLACQIFSGGKRLKMTTMLFSIIFALKIILLYLSGINVLSILLFAAGCWPWMLSLGVRFDTLDIQNGRPNKILVFLPAAMVIVALLIALDFTTEVDPEVWRMDWEYVHKILN